MNRISENIIDPTLDLFSEIEKLKKDKNAIILAHYYQEPDIQDIADYIGDSLGLARQAESTNADIIVFAGVHFMAETAKIINPEKKVLLPDLEAGCSSADSRPSQAFSEFKKNNPDHIVITYINCSAEIKALSDIICTSSNALGIINSLPKEQKIIFAPDKNLGQYLINKTGRDMLLWDGSCQVHELFSLEKILKLKIKNPDSDFIAHPECETEVLNNADFIGSTSELLKYTQNSDKSSFINVPSKSTNKILLSSMFFKIRNSNCDIFWGSFFSYISNTISFNLFPLFQYLFIYQ